MNEPKYTLTVTREQLGHISRACEVLARLRIGQVEDAMQELINREGKPWFVSWDTINALERMIEADGGYRNGSAGVGHSRAADVLWDLYQVMRYQLAWERAVESGEAERIGVWKPEERNKFHGVYHDTPLIYAPPQAELKRV